MDVRLGMKEVFEELDEESRKWVVNAASPSGLFFASARSVYVEGKTGIRNKNSKPMARVAESGISGQGVFASLHLPPHTVFAVVAGEYRSGSAYGSTYCYAIDPELALEPEPDNVGRFLNHSCYCNSESLVYPDSTGKKRLFLKTIDEVFPGDELTIDYCWPLTSAIPCFCGHETCRGFVIDPRDLGGLRLWWLRWAGLTTLSIREIDQAARRAALSGNLKLPIVKSPDSSIEDEDVGAVQPDE